MIDKIKEARNQAARLKARAAATADPESKALLLEVAAGWTEIAEIELLALLEAREKANG